MKLGVTLGNNDGGEKRHTHKKMYKFMDMKRLTELETVTS